MKKFFFFLYVCCFSVAVKAQKNPGYVGKINTFSIGTSISPYALLSAYAYAPTLSLNYERSIFRNMSLEFGYTRYSVKSNLTEINFGSAYDFYHLGVDQQEPAIIEGSGRVNHNDFSLTFKNYIGRTGAISPLGAYLGFVVQFSQWNHKNPKYTSFYYKGYDHIPMALSGDPSSIHALSVGLCLGKKSFITRSISFEWSIGSGVVLSSTVPKGTDYDYYNQNDYLNKRIYQAVFAKQVMDIKFKVGYLL